MGRACGRKRSTVTVSATTAEGEGKCAWAFKATSVVMTASGTRTTFGQVDMGAGQTLHFGGFGAQPCPNALCAFCLSNTHWP
eukprot:4244031-Amphidinium_carterae.1